jgi:general secretion pathway protein K
MHKNFYLLNNRQQGIALIQVLLISAVLSVLAIYLTSTAKDQVKIAQWTDEKAQALINQHSAQSQLMFTLLTQSRVQEERSKKGIARQWNFFAKAFDIDNGVSIKIQDQAGLIHAHFPNEDHLKSLIGTYGKQANSISAIFDALLDWQDLDSIPRLNGNESSSSIIPIRNGAIPDVHDFKFVRGVAPELYDALFNNTTIFRLGIFNPMNAPQQLLAAITSRDIAAQVIKLRNNNQLTNRLFSQITGIQENDSTIFYPSNFMAIEFESSVGQSMVKKSMTIQIMPYASGNNSPLNILSNHG